MATKTRSTERTARLTVLDRLIDLEPKSGTDPVVRLNESVEALRASLQRDLEWLLNTRRIAEPAPERFTEVRESVYHFGLPDITSLSGDSKEVRRILSRRVEECIRRFEPRLTAVRVTPVEADAENRRRIRFVIEGLLRMEPNPEHVVFDTVLETASGRFQVAGSGNA